MTRNDSAFSSGSSGRGLFMDSRGFPAGIREALAPLSDAEAGDVGARFLREFAATGCQTLPEKAESCLAAYVPFQYPGYARSFVNGIKYSDDAASDKALLTMAFTHEAFHAMQWAGTPALHASPFNTYTPVLPSPRDCLILAQLAEQDAYAKEAFFSSLLKAADPAYGAAMALKPVTAADIEHARREAPDLKSAFARAASGALDKFFKVENGKDVSFADHYHRVALEDYAWSLEKKQGHVSPLVVRLEDEDIRAIGKSLGLNMFENARLDDLRRDLRLSPENEALLSRLNERLGIRDESALPTFADGLARFGFTRDSFLDFSRFSASRESAAAPQARNVRRGSSGYLWRP